MILIDSDTGLIKDTSTDHRDVKSFLEELAGLSNKYKLIIDGCGCCGSPYLTSINNEESIKYTNASDSIEAISTKVNKL